MKNMDKATNKSDSMKISPHKRLVSMPIHAENIFHFPDGLPAFEHVKEFIFLMRPDTKPFVFMHALKPNDLAFVCVDPFMIYPEYCPRISEADRIALRLEKPEDALILSIVTIRSDARRSTANLQGPIVINIQSSIGRQIVCDGQSYPVRYAIWDAIDKINTKHLSHDAVEKEQIRIKTMR